MKLDHLSINDVETAYFNAVDTRVSCDSLDISVIKSEIENKLREANLRKETWKGSHNRWGCYFSQAVDLIANRIVNKNAAGRPQAIAATSKNDYPEKSSDISFNMAHQDSQTAVGDAGG